MKKIFIAWLLIATRIASQEAAGPKQADNGKLAIAAPLLTLSSQTGKNFITDSLSTASLRRTDKAIAQGANKNLGPAARSAVSDELLQNVRSRSLDGAEENADTPPKSSLATKLGLYLLNTYMGAAQVCNKSLISAIGITRPDDAKEFPVKNPESKTCFKNKKACCTEEEISQTQSQFWKAANKFGKNMDTLEEVLNLFRGNVAWARIINVSQNGQCNHAIKSQEGKGTIDDFLNIGYLTKIIEEIDSLLFYSQSFRKREQYFFGGVICSACGTTETMYYNFSKEVPKMNVDMRTCVDIVTNVQFEIRVVKLFRNFFIPLTKLFLCDEGKDSKELDISQQEDDLIAEREGWIEDCGKRFEESNPSCLKLCYKDLYKYDFPGNIFKVSKKVLRVLYQKFTSMSIEDYYQKVKKVEWNEDEDTTAFFFDTEKENFKLHKLDQLQWALSPRGTHIYGNYINKNYFAEKQAWLSVSLRVFGIISLIILR